MDQPLPGYTLLTQLYKVRHGMVYRAFREKDGVSVVIHLLRSPSTPSHDIIYFCNQYIITKNLNIPGIVNPLDLFPWSDGYAMIMEDVGGIPLEGYLQNRNGLSVEEGVAIAIQLTEVLHHLGQERILHQGINPANILIHPETQRIWLTNFTLATRLPEESSALHNPAPIPSQSERIDYRTDLAPEQAGETRQDIDLQTDFYSLGVTLNTILLETSERFLDNSSDSMNGHIVQNLLASPIEGSTSSSSIPPPLSEIILKLLGNDAANRYQTALEIKDDLQQCLDQWRTLNRIQSFTLECTHGLAMNGDEEQCLVAGASEYLSKPVKLKQLAQSIQQVLMP